MGFLYLPQDSKFTKASDGFQYGDIIFVDADVMDIKAAYPIQFPPKTDKKVRRKFIEVLTNLRKASL